MYLQTSLPSSLRVKKLQALDIADKEASGIEKALKEYLTASQGGWHALIPSISYKICLLELSIVGQQLSHEIKRMGEKIPENEWGNRTRSYSLRIRIFNLYNLSAQATIRLGDCQLLLEKLRMEHLVFFCDPFWD